MYREDNPYVAQVYNYDGVRGIIWDAFQNAYEKGLDRKQATLKAQKAYFDWGGDAEFRELITDVLDEEFKDKYPKEN